MGLTPHVRWLFCSCCYFLVVVVVTDCCCCFFMLLWRLALFGSCILLGVFVGNRLLEERLCLFFLFLLLFVLKECFYFGFVYVLFRCLFGFKFR
jgi:hypothetical protein